MEAKCPHCGMDVQKTSAVPARFCPFCGKTLGNAAQGPSDLEKRIQAEKNPKKKYKIIQDALAAAPDDFDANLALLYHGRLHESLTHGNKLDYAIIKCHLLSIFHTPDQYTPQELDAKYEELLRGPQLQKTMALAPDPDALFAEYVYALAAQYVDLFIRGDTRNNSVGFGFMRSQASLARRCAPIVRGMMAMIAGEERMTLPERQLFAAALREGYARSFPGHMGELDGE